MNFLTLEMIEIFEVGDILNLGGSELIVAGIGEGMAKIVPNTLYNRMLYCWPKQARRSVKGSFRFVRAFCAKYVEKPRCYVCHRHPAEEPGQLCYLCYELQHEVAEDLAMYLGRDE